MKKIIFPLLIFVSVLFPQKRETRAVWIATNFRLDWPPPTYNEIEQKLALDKIFETIKKRKFNTVYFQAVVKATAFYRSEILPFNLYINGNEKPTYDPLQYAISLAKIYGLEIHAWVNTARVFSGDEDEFVLLPEHIINKHPEWIIKRGKGKNKSFWLNMGIPEARDFMISVAKEIVEKYDVNGIQFDFLRYPIGNFPDSETYLQYSDSMSLANWRRENINNFIRVAYDTLKSIKHTIKIGVAPFGIYKTIEGADGAESFSDVYQDTQTWLKNGWVDYVVPQTYWNIDDNPRFDSLAYYWGKNSFGRNVILGIAIYKNSVRKNLKKIIEISRESGAKGISFFRYKYLAKINSRIFTQKVFPAEMPWIDSTRPLPPSNFLASYENDYIKFSWAKSLSEHVSYYSLYDVTSIPNIITLFPKDVVAVRMKINKPKAVINKFRMSAVNNLWNESKPTKTATVELKKLSELINTKNIIPAKPFVVQRNDKFFLVLYSEGNTANKIEINSEVNKLQIELTPGINFVELPWRKINGLRILFPQSGNEIGIKN